ncbi:hypothetical protein BDI4_670039 [Burkholderia diffusa]|nr:hypothetical protein BDI4_670039 [Burkholderia diffusa]
MRTIRGVVAGVWLFALGAFVYSPSGVGQTVTPVKLWYSPWGSPLSIPTTAPPGTVVLRALIPVDWMALCGQPSCEITSVTLYDKGLATNPPIAGPDISSRNPGLKMQVLFDGQPVTSSSVGVKPSRVELIAIRTSSAVYTTGLSYLTTTGMTVFGVGGGSSFSVNAGQAPVTPIVGTCNVPDKTVNLPQTVVYQFGGVGTTTNVEVPFDLQMEACPAGYNHVGYTLAPAGGAPASANGVLPNGPGTTASGVAIQLTDPGGTPVQFNTPMNLTSYDTATGGSYTVPLVARYIQTAETIGVGAVTGVVEVLMDYR